MYTKKIKNIVGRSASVGAGGGAEGGGGRSARRSFVSQGSRHTVAGVAKAFVSIERMKHSKSSLNEELQSFAMSIPRAPPNPNDTNPRINAEGSGGGSGGGGDVKQEKGNGR